MKGYTETKGIVYRNTHRVIFCPRHRRSVLTGDIKKELEEIIHSVADKNSVTVLSLYIHPNYVDLTIDLDPRKNVHKIIKDIKAVSAHELRPKYETLSKMASLWTRNYISSTVGSMRSKDIEEYIKAQKTRG